jgi:DNA-binding winged helix-turn-helix (wHTH) protein/tetratricopeptide (TPR) repeat protein
MRPGTGGRIVRFGSFEADIDEGKLTKSGIRIRLQEQPFRILALLLESAGQVVSREQLRQELWSTDTFVEFDKALNTAVGKLRAALSDSADNPRFLETVPRRGYRFIAPVTFPPPRPANLVPVQAATPEISASSDSEIGQIGVMAPGFASEKVHRRPATVIGAIVLLMVTAFGIYWYRHRPGFQISPQDTIMLADFVNTTGEAVFDDALRQGLEVGLEQSPFVKVLPDRKAERILKQMGRSSDERMTGRTAIEVCQRASGKVTVQGSIASLGTNYLIGLAAIRCDSGEPVANEQVQAKRKEDVVDALGRVTTRLRARLGESLPSIERYNAPLEQATTVSLDALNAYGLALSTWDKKGDRESLPIFHEAIKLDPNFAMAYGGQATVYHNLGESDLARENAAKAYELRSRVTESERATIDARYYSYVTGELEKSARVHALEVQNYPESPGAYNHLAIDDGKLGRYEESVEGLRKALRLDPTRAATYSNLAGMLLALNRVEDASAVVTEAGKRQLQTDSLMQAGYRIAFLRGDSGEMQHLVQQSLDVPGGQSLLLSDQSNTEAYHGRYGKARESSRVAARLMEHNGDTESAANCLAQAAVREAEVGDSARASQFISEALKLSRGQDVRTLAALSMARMGRFKRAEALSQELDKEWPVGTYVQKYWLPLIRAEIDLGQGRSSKAVDDLNLATTPIEFAIPPAMPVATLYPAYVRGQAYLAAGNARKALTEFQKFSGHSGLVANYPLGALARLGLARAYSRTGDIQKARLAYQEFFQLWKDADPDIPILRKAKAEHAKLH